MAEPWIDQLSMVLVANVVRMRKARAWTQVQLAEAMTAVGVPWDRSIVGNVECGRRQSFAVAELAALARIFGVADPWDLTKAPECDRCGGAPPDGYICAACGVGGNRG